MVVIDIIEFGIELHGKTASRRFRKPRNSMMQRKKNTPRLMHVVKHPSGWCDTAIDRLLLNLVTSEQCLARYNVSHQANGEVVYHCSLGS
jgi:hypothetical protein